MSDAGGDGFVTPEMVDALDAMGPQVEWRFMDGEFRYFVDGVEKPGMTVQAAKPGVTPEPMPGDEAKPEPKLASPKKASILKRFAARKRR